MLFAIWAFLTTLGLGCGLKFWWEGREFRNEPRDFPILLVLLAVKGLILGTTLLPPSHGLFAGMLFFYWTIIAVITLKDNVAAAVYSHRRLGIMLFADVVFSTLVCLSYFGG